jgi:predicted ATP-grasp superfamily ATP-dependent carboligase
MADINLHYAVVLHIAFTGYGVVRSLASYNIPVVAFQKDLSMPEAKSKLCEKVISFDNDEELLEKLICFSKEKDKKPVLIITSDIYVEFFVHYRDEIEKHYLIHYPSNEIVELLLNKNKFSEYAAKNNILIPKSDGLKNDRDLELIKKEFTFPVALKPYTKSQAWLDAKLPKIYIVHTYNELAKLYKKIKNIEGELLVQEWVPGSDSNVHYCLTYFDENHECLAAFTGYKLRQWPVGTGSTATTMPVENEWIKKDTIRIFKSVDYAGFGSIEYKKHDINGKYYIMEPTVGRLNQQEYVTTLNGMNIPLIAYNSLTGLNIAEQKPHKPPVIYIDEWAELYSALTHFKRKLITFKEWRSSIKGNRAYRYWNKEDKSVFFASLFKTLRAVFKLSAWKMLRSS